MMLKKQIPNIFTLLNLLSGIIGVLMALTDNLVAAALFVFFGIFFDFFDGFFARKFKVEGDFGKQLDSLADMVTSGLIPGIVMFQLMLFSVKGKYFMEISSDTGNWDSYYESFFYFIPMTGFIITLAAAWRLANFNIDTRQSNAFIGLPTPAFALFVVSLPLIIFYTNDSFIISSIQNLYVLILFTVMGSYLMNAELPLFSLKFKNYSWSDNKIKYIFLLLSALLLIGLRTTAIPLLIIIYVAISLADNVFSKNKK